MPQLKYVFFVFLPSVALLGFIFFHRAKTLSLFSGIDSRTVSSGGRAAKALLDSFNLFDVRIERENKRGRSRYLLQEKAVMLSPFDYESASFTAIARAQHQVGHTVQHMKGTGMFYLKAFLYPAVQKGGTAALLCIPLSLFPSMNFLYPPGAFLFTCYVFFSLTLLPFEFEATRRIYEKLQEIQLFPPDELKLVQKVLEAVSLGTLVGLFNPFNRLAGRNVS